MEPQTSTRVETTAAHEAPLAEQVFRRILGLIRSGVLRPGQALPPERELAESMGVGRPSLREALRALAVLGVLDIRRREGVFVRSLDLASLLEPLHVHLAIDAPSLDQLFEARMVFEPGIAELAAARIEGAQLAALRACLDGGADALDDVAAFVRLDAEFHQLIADVTDNAFLQRMAQSFWELGKVSRQITDRLPGVLRRSQEDHRRIFAALERHDAAAAGTAMRQHLMNVRAVFHLSKIDLRRPRDGALAATTEEA
jgi:GntR family transcriptional regulator, transcriptional repressor for pyruvate dehydrogenase complex